MAKLTEEAKKVISDLHVAHVATASKEGKPNVSPKGSFRVVDDEHVAFGNAKSPRTIANLKQNPQISAILFDPATRKGCRIWGQARILTSGEVMDKMNAEYAAKNVKFQEIVLVTVEDSATF